MLEVKWVIGSQCTRAYLANKIEEEDKNSRIPYLVAVFGV